LFTGIVQAIGEVDAVDGDGESGRIRLRLPQGFGPLQSGESLAVDGACLTATGPATGTFLADVSWETLSRTTLGGKSRGQRVNLERALRPVDHLGGHFVTGHIDAVGAIRHLVSRGANWELAVDAPERVLRYCVEKGSVAVDGISLTIATLGESGFTCAIIPSTFDQTTLRDRRPGDPVNLEADLIGKYVHRFWSKDSTPSPGLTFEALARAGFVEQE